MSKNIFRSTLLTIFFLIFSCEELEEDTKCLDAQAEILAAITSFTQDRSVSSCNMLKTAAQDFISNSCTDTTGFGGLDPNFIADSLECDLIACEMPIAQLLQYTITMEMSTDLDSSSYCAYYDSTITAMEAIVAAGGCAQDGFEGVTQAMVDSVKAAGCDWLQEITLLTATFHEEFDPSVKSFIFITDSDGSVLADTGFYNTGDDSFILKKSYPKNQIIPEKIGVTIASYELEYDHYGLTTNLGIDIGSDFHYYNPNKDEPTDFIGQSYYIFTNIDDWTGDAKLNLASKGSTSFGTSCCWDETTQTNQGSAYLNHYYDNEDVLIMLHREDGTGGFINIENVSIGDTTVVDLSALESTEIVQIPNNTGEPYAYHNFYGYGESSSYTWWNRLARLKSRSGPGLDFSDDNFIVKYPQSVISKFRIDTYVGDGYLSPGGTQYQQRMTGDLPSSVEKIDVTFDVISWDVDDIEISHSGSFDQWTVGLRDTSINADWYVYNNSTSSTMILPSIPTSVINEYPVLYNPKFSGRFIRLTDWMCAESYKEWTELYHSTDGYYLDFCSGLRDATRWPPE